VVAEIGINHNGSVALAKDLSTLAKAAGCDAVKFQKRTPELCVPEAQRDVVRHGTPWGDVTYMEYRRKVEFGQAEYEEVDKHCRSLGLHWFASCWDVPSVDFVEQFQPPCHKVASATLTDKELLKRLRRAGRPILLSTGMSTLDQVDAAVKVLNSTALVVMQSTSAYPAKYPELNLRVIPALRQRYGTLVGYSGHETGIASTVAAVALGACVVERHVTLDRAMWGTDQAASLGPTGLTQLVRDIRLVEQALGDGVKKVEARELPVIEKLRRVR